MAQHVYMSNVPAVPGPDGERVLPSGAVMRYRGETGPADDAVSFAAKMAQRGHVVRTVGEYKGEAVTLAVLEG